MTLNTHQERAVTAPGHCTILACPGSGKTRVLTERAIRLLSSHARGRLCAVTFTKDAATELKDRILPRCSPSAGKRIAVGTFHSIALSQLKRSGIVRKMPRLLTEGERLALLRRCLACHSNKIQLDEAVASIDKAKSSTATLSFSSLAIESVFNDYQRTLEAENAMDFSDIMLRAVSLMESGDLAPLPIKWLLVDEAQDMDQVQLEWIKFHGLSGIEVTVVGDDDQSLYAFRHALGHQGLQDLTTTLCSTETTLSLNYRCSPNILLHAGKLIQHNKVRAFKRIEPSRTTPGKVEVIRAADREDEAELVIDRIRHHVEDSKWAVLARTNAILDEFEVELSGSGIPYRRTGGKCVWDQKLGSTLLGLLKSVIDDAPTGVANALAFAGASVSMLSMGHYKSSAGGIEFIDDRLQNEKLTIEDRRLLSALRSGMKTWTHLQGKGRTDLVIHGVSSWMKPCCKDELMAQQLDRLVSTLVKVPGSLAQRILLLSTPPSTKSACHIQLMTLHGSKGLEFDHVWIYGAEEGNLPHTDSPEEEERRLMYVGMTRARNGLFISSALKEGSPSRFIRESGLS